MELHVRDLYDDVPDDTPTAVAEPTPLNQVLAALGERVSPIAMAGERVLPVASDLHDLFPEGGLVRGRVLSCVGGGATSTALRAVAAAASAGSWVAVIDVPTLGLDAAVELGVPLERIVAVDTGAGASGSSDVATSWADAVAAAADGFELLISRVPADVAATTVRRVATRLQQRGAVMLVLGDPGPLVCDGTLESADRTWSGIGRGWGHLATRALEVTASGRRLPGRRCVTVSIPADLPHPTEALASDPVEVAPTQVPALRQLSNAS